MNNVALHDNYSKVPMYRNSLLYTRTPTRRKIKPAAAPLRGNTKSPSNVPKALTHVLHAAPPPAPVPLVVEEKKVSAHLVNATVAELKPEPPMPVKVGRPRVHSQSISIDPSRFPDLFRAEKTKDVAIGGPFKCLLTLPDGKIIGLTETKIQLIEELVAGQELKIIAEKEGAFSSIALHPEGYVVALKSNNIVVVYSNTLSQELFCLGRAQQMVVGTNGIIYCMYTDKEFTDLAIKHLLAWNLATNRFEYLDIKHWQLTKEGLVCSDNGYVLFKKCFGKTLSPARELRISPHTCVSAESIGNGYVRFIDSYLDWVNVWDTNSTLHFGLIFNLPIRNRELSLLHSLVDEETFLVGMGTAAQSDLYIYHLGSSLLYPLEIRNIKVLSYTQTPSGSLLFCLQNQQGEFFIREYDIPYLKILYAEIYKIMEKLSSSEDALPSIKKAALSKGALPLIGGYLGMFQPKKLEHSALSLDTEELDEKRTFRAGT